MYSDLPSMTLPRQSGLTSKTCSRICNGSKLESAKYFGELPPALRMSARGAPHSRARCSTNDQDRRRTCRS